MRAGAAALAALVALAAPAPARADLPADQQALLLLRVLAYDRNLKSRAGGSAAIAVVYRGGDRASEACRDGIGGALQQAARRFTVAGLPVRVRPVPWADARRFEDDLAAAQATSAFVCPGLGGVAREIAAVTRRRWALSFAGSPAMVDAGIAVGLIERGTRAAVLVDLRAARAEGADLDAGLLRIAEVRR